MRIAASVLFVVAVFTGARGWGEGTNMTLNPGFEQAADPSTTDVAADWVCWGAKTNTLIWSSDTCRNGQHSIQWSVQHEPNSFTTIFQTQPVQEGKRYEFRVFVRNALSSPLDGTAHGSLGIEWIGAYENEIGRASSERWTREISSLRWSVIKVAEKAPPGAMQAKFVIHFSDGEGDASGACYVDDVTIIEK